MKKAYIILVLIYSLTSFAQKAIEYKNETINALDENNNQTGIWKVYDEENNVLISCEFKEGKLVSDTKFYKDDKLIASYNNQDKLEIFKDSKTIVCNFFRKEDNSQTLIDPDGNELDTETIKYYYQSAEVMPMYYGGIRKLYEFIGINIDGKGKTGKVKVQFQIDSKGYATEIEIKESTNPKLDNEAKRIISLLPRWQPAHQGGTFVKCSYTIPITIN
ncbi:Gram-negative bacterial tonB protein [compost metagenome]